MPYHNFWHCVDVAHTTFLCLSKTRHRTAVTLQESLALLIAAICHDLEHPGASASPITCSSLTQHVCGALNYQDEAARKHRHPC